jgi:hypothetical protein
LRIDFNGDESAYQGAIGIQFKSVCLSQFSAACEVPRMMRSRSPWK